ncbi:hypothetical protein QYE76_065943 [Lolium multiflorum]|uniref:Uncharacterized protein n=1 Tax=Lolium multiflorum TaxID=4521 RepID=A0AAD8W9C4_LOLMU|nr:hypothetical protein QYE76_065943 [Lolium multiflorum]
MSYSLQSHKSKIWSQSVRCLSCLVKRRGSGSITESQRQHLSENKERMLNLLQCPVTEFPIRYLGLELALGPLTKDKAQRGSDNPYWTRSLSLYLRGRGSPSYDEADS